MTDSTNYDWSRKSLAELEAFYWSEIAPVVREAGGDPGAERPTYRWLADNGFAGIDYALREHHDLTVAEFFRDVVGVGEDPAGYDWGIDHAETVDALERYLDARRRRKNWTETTIRTKRYRLATYARTYRDCHGVADLVTPLRDPDERPAETDRCYAVLDALDERLESEDSKYHYLTDVADFYARRVDTGRAEYDPLANATDEFDWRRTGTETRALSAGDVRALYRAAEGADRILVLALCGWGLRPSEVAALHEDQLRLDGEDPRIEFDDERKNGPGTVAVIYGREALEAHLDRLAADSDPSGYVFPSSVSATGHRSTDTLRNRFARLAEAADVRVAGERPTPKHGRRFWYDAYLDAQGELVDRLAEIAPEQGSASAEVIADHYIPEERKRSLRRELMADRLAAAFE